MSDLQDQFHPLSCPDKTSLNTIVLAGGRGSRVGFRQKALLPYQGKPILLSILQTLKPQCQTVWVNMNVEPEIYQPYCEALFSDESSEFLGPLAGMHAAWHQLDTEWLVFVPCDNPHLPEDFITRLISAYQLNPAPLVVADDGERIQPLYLLMHKSMSASLASAIAKSHLSVYRWIEENDFSKADFSDCAPQAFQNLNTLEAFQAASSE
ncbi:MAG: molybdenum cofactor guanylyltransferase [Thiomicrorhabdus sp.]|nr:MAG: molybdenum cofactor guanylyltransferase [Thiomicrorhabdus sp.]